MSNKEKTFTIFYWSYIAVYVACFLAAIATGVAEQMFWIIFPFHMFGMLIGIQMLIILFRDVYQREFADPNSKVMWAIAMLLFWPCIPFYLYHHGFCPRNNDRPQRDRRIT